MAEYIEIEIHRIHVSTDERRHKPLVSSIDRASHPEFRHVHL